MDRAEVQTEVAAVTALRGDGPLAAAMPRVLPVPGLVLLLAGSLLVAMPAALGVVAVVAPVPVPVPTTAAVLTLIGVGLALLARMGRPLARLDWLAPSLLRALEYAAVLVLVPLGPWPYLWLATIAYHHYDLVYRARTRGVATPRWLVSALGGWEGRTLLLAVAALLGHAETVAWVLVPVLALVLTTETLTALRREARDASGPS